MDYKNMSRIDIDVYDFIQNLIHKQGRITFSELIKLSGLSNSDSLSIENNLKKEHPPILKKGRSYLVKGFNKTTQNIDIESPQESSINMLQYKWEKEGAEKLTELISFSNLLHLTDGDIRYAFRKLRQEYTGDTRSSFTKRELAYILFHGRDLFADKIIRFSIAKAFGIKKRTVPQRWVPGSFSSRNFINSIGFPSEFSGIKTEIEKQASSEFLSKEKFNKLVDFKNGK